MSSLGIGENDPSKLNESIETLLTQAIQSNAEALDPSIPAVLAGHLSVDSAKTSSETSMMLGKDYLLLQTLKYYQMSHESSGALVGSLAVSASHRNQGIGREMVEAMKDEARRHEFRELFAITMSQSSLFEQCGFEAVEPERLPEWKLKDFDYPESRVFRFKIKRS